MEKNVDNYMDPYTLKPKRLNPQPLHGNWNCIGLPEVAEGPFRFLQKRPLGLQRNIQGKLGVQGLGLRGYKGTYMGFKTNRTFCRTTTLNPKPTWP